MYRSLSRTTATPLLRKLAALTALLLLLTACAGTAEGGESESGGVASLSGDQTANETATEGVPEDPEELLLEWVECMRAEGVDVADPTVDADGNLTLGARPGGAGAQGDDAQAGQAGDLRESFDAAGEVCGDTPIQRGGLGFSDVDQTAFQDAFLVFAQCMRDEGFDVADPQFDAAAGGGPGGGGGAGGIFGDLDLEDSTTSAAFDACQESAFADSGLELPGARGAGGGRGGQQ